MTTERTPSHSAVGLERRSAVWAIHSISPCHSRDRAAWSLSPRSGRASAVVIPNASNPSAFARARSSVTAELLFARNVPFHQHADIARIRNAARLRPVFDGIQQWLRHAKAELHFLLEFEVSGLKL